MEYGSSLEVISPYTINAIDVILNLAQDVTPSINVVPRYRQMSLDVNPVSWEWIKNLLDEGSVPSYLTKLIESCLGTISTRTYEIHYHNRDVT